MEHSQKRKLVAQGNGALTITLPKKWTTANNLSAKDYVFLHDQDANLIIKLSQNVQEHKTTIHLKEQTAEDYRSLLGTLYRGGFNKLNVKFDNLKDLPAIESAIDSLYGFEITNLNNNSCVVQTDIDQTPRDIAKTIQKMRFALKAMLACVKTGASQTDTKQLRTTILTQRDFIMRIIKTQRKFQNSEFPYYAISNALWEIARNLYYMHKAQKKPLTKQDISLLHKYEEFFDECFNPKNYTSHEEYLKLNPQYQTLRKHITKQLTTTQHTAFLLPALMSLQFASSMYFITFQKQ